MKKLFKKYSGMLALAVIGLTLAGCGKPIMPDMYCLSFAAIGERDNVTSHEVADSTNGVANAETKVTVNSNASVKLLTYGRAPLNVGQVINLWFPKGVQSYRFTAKESIESPNNEGLTVGTMGGEVSFDFEVHMKVMDDLSPEELKNRLIALATSYQLRRFDGAEDSLSGLISSARFTQTYNIIINDYTPSLKIIDLIRGKVDFNKHLLDKLNEEFMPLGVEFTLAGMSSATRMRQTQQNELNKIMKKEIDGRILNIETGTIQPLEAQVEAFVQKGETDSQAKINEANATAIKLVADAKKRRRKAFIDLVGKENYGVVELAFINAASLEGSATRIDIVPEKAWVSLESSAGKAAATR